MTLWFLRCCFCYFFYGNFSGDKIRFLLMGWKRTNLVLGKGVLYSLPIWHFAFPFLLDDGKIFSWGWNKYGQVWNPQKSLIHVALLVIDSFYYVCATAGVGRCDRSQLTFSSEDWELCSQKRRLWLVAYTSPSRVSYLIWGSTLDGWISVRLASSDWVVEPLIWIPVNSIISLCTNVHKAISLAKVEK